MAKTAPVPERRSDALTRERIVQAAVELLDASGEGGLTFRALATSLQTGHGAIQWHVTSKGELLKAATAATIAAAMGAVESGTSPREAVHAIAVAVFEAIETHPWIGAQLAQPPWQATMLEIFERIGREVQALGASVDVQFSATSALLVYIIGAGGQEARTSRAPVAREDRQVTLDALASRWDQLDPDEYAFTRTMSGRLRDHDDREEFLAGIDLILTGLVHVG
jgi:AcrR family transcriptional regulator